MTKRLEELYALLGECEVFCDIGCDHGYITEAMLKGKKCKRAIASDISEKCLEKAKNLLRDFIKEGVCSCVVSDGFDNVLGCDLALIAGMGGEEIISILKRCKNLPKTVVLQPMKNAEKVRKSLQKLRYQIVTDYTFTDGGKFYDVIKAQKQKKIKKLNKKQLKFGLTNLEILPPAFKDKLLDRKKIILNCLQENKLSKKTQKKMKKELKGLNEYVIS